jgi:hypothetical protein
MRNVDSTDGATWIPRMTSPTPPYCPMSALVLQTSLMDIGLAGDFGFIYNVLHIENERMLAIITQHDVDTGNLKVTLEQYIQIFESELDKCTHDSPDCEHKSIEGHTEELFRKLNQHVSKPQHVLEAEDFAAEMKDTVHQAEHALRQVDDLAKTETVEGDVDMHRALAGAETALQIAWIRLGEGHWKRIDEITRT